MTTIGGHAMGRNEKIIRSLSQLGLIERPKIG